MLLYRNRCTWRRAPKAKTSREEIKTETQTHTTNWTHREEYPNLKRSQYKEKIHQLWKKSPEVSQSGAYGGTLVGLLLVVLVVVVMVVMMVMVVMVVVVVVVVSFGETLFKFCLRWCMCVAVGSQGVYCVVLRTPMCRVWRLCSATRRHPENTPRANFGSKTHIPCFPPPLTVICSNNPQNPMNQESLAYNQKPGAAAEAEDSSMGLFR